MHVLDARQVTLKKAEESLVKPKQVPSQADPIQLELVCAYTQVQVLDAKQATLKKAEESRLKSKQAALAKEAAGSKKISSFFGKPIPKPV